jgi:hypothetical protein
VHPRPLTVAPGAETDVFLLSGSPQERKQGVDEILKGQRPAIVLCSIQYTPDGLDTIQFFHQHGYSLFIHWLNPGRSDPGLAPDTLSLVKTALATQSMIGVRDGRAPVGSRVEEIRQFIHGWADARGLLRGSRATSTYAPQTPASMLPHAVP